jgi:hypothetical protein
MKRLLSALAILVILAGSANLALAAKPAANHFGKRVPAAAVHNHPFYGGAHHVYSSQSFQRGYTVYPPYTGSYGVFSTYGGTGYGTGLYGGYDRPVVYGNPAHSFVPAAAFGFGPGAIYGW